MTNSNTASNNIVIKKKSNLLRRLLATLFVTIIALLLAAPIAIKQGLQHWLSEQTQSNVTIAEVRLNLFSGTFSLRQLKIPHHGDSELASSLGFARITIDWAALLDNEILIKELLINHTALTIERNGKQLRIAGIAIPSAATPEQEPNQPPVDTSANGLGITVASIKLKAITLNYLSDEIDTRIKIASTTIDGITTTDPNKTVNFALNLGINSGQINYQGSVTPSADELTVTGELVITELDLTPFLALVPQQDFDFNHLSLSLQSRIDAALPKDAAPRINLLADATLNGLDLVSILDDNTSIKATTIAFNEINVQYPAAVTVGEIVIDNLDTSLYQNSDGLLLNSQRQSPTPSQPLTQTDNGTKQDSKETPMAFRLGKFVIQGDSKLQFSDATVTPPFNIKLHPLMLTAGPIDTTQQDAQTAIKLSANINEHGSLKLEGHIAPLAKEMVVMLNSSLKGLELPTLSPYTEAYIGYQLRRGRIAAETNLLIKGDKLKVSNELTLTKLSIKESDEEKAKGLIEQLEMPLDSALDLLRDGDDNIVFDLPVEGRLDDPHFELDGVIKLAIGKGMKMAAMKYLTNALQPLGTILLVKDVVGMITKPRFKPLTFNAGEATLNEHSLAYLEKIAALLKKRPKLAITLCGIANEDDRTVLMNNNDDEAKAVEPQLHTLAKARADNARGYLTSQYGIENTQLFKCNPEINSKKGEVENMVEGMDIIL